MADTEIKFNDEIYVLKSHVIAEYVLKSEIAVSPLSKPQLLRPVLKLMDEVNVMAIGSAELNGDWQTVRISTGYLRRALDVIESITAFDKKKRTETITVSFAKDMPFCIGATDTESGKFSGVVIAPRVEHS